MGNAHELSVWDFHFAIYFLVTTYKSVLFQVSVTLYGQKIALDLISAANTLLWVELKSKEAQRCAKLLFFPPNPLSLLTEVQHAQNSGKKMQMFCVCVFVVVRLFFTLSASSYLF